MLTANTGITSDALKQSRRYAQYDVVNVYLRSDVVEPPSINSRLAFVHINNIPSTPVFEFAKIKSALTQCVASVVTPNQVDRVREWNLAALSEPQKSLLISDREITLTFAEFKIVTRKKYVANVSNATLDTFDTVITDADIM